MSGEHVAQRPTTQAANPNRAALRTALQTAVPAFLGLLILVPLIIQAIVDGFGQALPDDLRLRLLGAAALITATAGVLARIMAIPGVIEWTRAYLPWLAPDKK